MMSIRFRRKAARAATLVCAVTLASALTLGTPQGVASTAASATATAARLVAIRAEHHPAFDRVVFEFAGRVPAQRHVRYVSALIADPSGHRARIAGRAILKVSLSPVVAHDPAGQATAPARIALALPNVMSRSPARPRCVRQCGLAGESGQAPNWIDMTTLKGRPWTETASYRH